VVDPAEPADHVLVLQQGLVGGVRVEVRNVRFSDLEGSI
jgi:hypothetical protein